MHASYFWKIQKRTAPETALPHLRTPALAIAAASYAHNAGITNTVSHPSAQMLLCIKWLSSDLPEQKNPPTSQTLPFYNQFSYPLKALGKAIFYHNEAVNRCRKFCFPVQFHRQISKWLPCMFFLEMCKLRARPILSAQTFASLNVTFLTCGGSCCCPVLLPM